MISILRVIHFETVLTVIRSKLHLKPITLYPNTAACVFGAKANMPKQINKSIKHVEVVRFYLNTEAFSPPSTENKMFKRIYPDTMGIPEL